MASADYVKAKEAARALLTKYNVTSPVVPVFEIAQQEGLSIKLFDMPDKLMGVAGFFDPAKKTIYVNKEEPYNRQVFTVAHELAHYILQHDAGKIGVLPRWPSKQRGTENALEQEANCFAAELLVPSQMLNSQIKEYDLTTNDSLVLAKLFGVSKAVMDIRLKHSPWKRTLQYQ
jgi:Zn-dependent peptidase ImmA (M78 family)